MTGGGGNAMAQPPERDGLIESENLWRAQHYHPDALRPKADAIARALVGATWQSGWQSIHVPTAASLWLALIDHPHLCRSIPKQCIFHIYNYFHKRFPTRIRQLPCAVPEKDRDESLSGPFHCQTSRARQMQPPRSRTFTRESRPKLARPSCVADGRPVPCCRRK